LALVVSKIEIAPFYEAGMLSLLSNLLLTIGIVAITLVCPFIRKTRKGIIFVHYALLHASHSWNNLGNELPVGSGVTSILVGSSVLILLAEHALTLNEKETYVTSIHDYLILFGFLASVDFLAIFLHKSAFFVGSLSFAIGILFVTFYLILHPRKAPSEISIDELDKIADGTFFFDLTGSFNCLGRNGHLHLSVVLLRFAFALVPYTSGKEVQNLFAVAECVCTWLILTAPVVVGGFVQTVKLVGRTIIEHKYQKKLLEAERKEREDGTKKRTREEILASLEEMYDANDELGITELI